MLKIYNTLTQQKDKFVPIKANHVGIYVCGMTVYDYCHIGHARVMVVFDMIVRQLRRHFKQVNYVRNITDIDDKIIKRAIQNKESIQSLTTRFIDKMHQDERALLVLAPDIEPKATEHLNQMFAMVQKLIDNGLAYQANNGDIYYAVRQFKDYGNLSGKSLDDLQSGARVAVDTHKKDPLDFVLWKSQTNADEANWSSPWGLGRPGWHLECSAMSCHYLGHHFDIHGGGADLSFPHHENEIAQSQGANNTPFVNTWMHIGFVNIDQEKMSKSLNNFTTIKDALKQYDGEILRYFILSSHYRSPLNYSEDNLINAKNSLTRLYIAMSHLKLDEYSQFDTSDIEAKFNFSKRFFNALDDDFNTPIALSILFDLAKQINIHKTTNVFIATALTHLLKSLGEQLGLLQNTNFLTQIHQLDASEIEEKIQTRQQARNNKDFALSDKIRDELFTAGIILEDDQGGTSWRKK